MGALALNETLLWSHDHHSHPGQPSWELPLPGLSCVEDILPFALPSALKLSTSLLAYLMPLVCSVPVLET